MSSVRERVTDEETFIRETAAIVPDEKTYQFVGYLQPRAGVVWVHDEKPETSITALLKAKRIKRLPGRDDETSDAARGLLLSADGRLFIEREEVFDRRLEAEKSMPPTNRATSKPREDDLPSEGEMDEACCEPKDASSPQRAVMQAAGATPAVGPDGRVLVADDRPVADTIHGTDGRSLVTSSAYPWRAVGVALLRRTSPAGQTPASYSRWASGTMIGPIHVLTAAHVFTDGVGVDNVIGAAPAARGYNYMNDALPYTDCGYTPKFPYGIRRVQWYYWPGQWNDSGVKFDYAVLILYDNCSTLPGWIVWGYQTTTWLDYRFMNMAGYPAPNKHCDASPEGNKDCDGYMYYQHEQTNAVYTNYAYSRFDVQEGQSGAGMYYKSGNTRIVYVIHKGSVGPYTYGKRLRSGSFSSICDWVDNWTSQYAGNPTC